MISVIIPNYNHAIYFDQRIKSILQQTFQDFEIIILDDCSKDNSLEIINKYINHPKVSNIVLNKENSGNTFKQWEKGIKLAKGDFIWLAESDDYCEPLFLSSLMEIFKKRPGVILAYCASVLVDKNNNKIGVLERNLKHRKEDIYINNGITDCKDHLLFHPEIPNASAVVFKKNAFYKVSESYKNYKIAGDWQFWVDVSLQGDIAYLSCYLNYFRQSDTSVSRSNHHAKDYYKTFLLEKLKVGLHILLLLDKKISLKHRLKYINQSLYHFLLESFRKRIFLNHNEKKFIANSLFSFSWLAPVVFIKAFIQVIILGMRKIIKSVLGFRL